MKNLHAKSPCCREKIIRFGSRRRQCVSCRKTWRIRQKKKGRKINRPVIDLVEKYLRGEIPPLYRAARCQNRFSEAQLQRRLKKSLERFVLKTPWPGFEYNHSFIVIADAMMIKIQSEIYLLFHACSGRLIPTKPLLLNHISKKTKNRGLAGTGLLPLLIPK